MLRVGSEYNTELQKIVLRIKKDVQALLLPAIEESVPEYTADAWPQRIQEIIDRLRLMYSMPTFNYLASQIASRFVRSALDFADRKNRGFGIEVFNGESTKLNAYLEAATIQNANLIKSIPQRYLDDVANTVQTGMRAGVLPRAIAKELTEKFGVAERRAKFIARDQAAKVNGEITKQRQIDAGYEYLKWIDADDSRVRHRHREIANKETPYGLGVYKWTELPLSDDGTPIQPGQDYNCFTGDSELNIFAGAKKVFRHFYTGELTSIRMSDNSVCESTPNHPILTERGFVAAHELNVGDYVIKVTNQSFLAVQGDGKSLNTTFSQVFSALSLVGSCESATSVGGELHGDVVAGKQINVVSIDWSLPRGFDASACKQFAQELLAVADQMIVLPDASCYSDFCAVLQGLTLAPTGVVRSLGKFLAIDFASVCHSDKHSLASIGLLYASFIKNTSDDVARGIEFFSDCFDAHSSIKARSDLFKRYILLVIRFAFGCGHNKIPSSQYFGEVIGVASESHPGLSEIIPLQYERVAVVDKSVREFSGHVYNLEMENGLFVSQDVAVSNCRCIARPVRNSVVEKHIASKKN